MWYAGELREAIEVGRRALRPEPDDLMLGFEHWGLSPYVLVLGWIGYLEGWTGQPSEALADLERALGLAREQNSAELQGYFHMWAVWPAVFLGDTDSALIHARQSLEAAEKSATTLARVFAFYALGVVHAFAGDWKEAGSCLERTLALSRETGLGGLDEPLFLAPLAEMYARLGEPRRARETVERGVSLAQALHLPVFEMWCHLARARVLLWTEGARARDAIDAALDLAEARIERTGATSWHPFLHVERAELARLHGDDATRERELREAHRLFAEMGATPHAERLAKELGL